MFSFFRKKNKGIDVTDFVWLNEAAKFSSLLQEAGHSENLILLTWFDETADRLQDYFLKNGGTPDIRPAQRITARECEGRDLIFAEHYPLRGREEERYQQLNLQKPVIYSSLDEPLMLKFGGDGIVSLIRKMGVHEGESISHPFISASIAKAQDKLQKALVVETAARSQAEWFQRNGGLQWPWRSSPFLVISRFS